MKKNTLSIKIDTQEPMELKEVMRYLDAIEKEYASYCENILDLPKKHRKLEIIKLEKGSWVIDLTNAMEIAAATAVVQPLVMNSIIDFGEDLIAKIKSFAKQKQKEISDEYPFMKNTMQSHDMKNTVQSHDNFIKFLNLSTNYGNTHIHTYSDGESVSKEVFSSAEFKAAWNNAVKYREELLEELLKEKAVIEHNQRFYWDSVSFSKSKVSDKGVIEELDEKAHKITFRNNGIKKDMVKFNAKFKKAWQDLLYVVTVEVTKKGDKIISYKILDVDLDETTEKIN